MALKKRLYIEDILVVFVIGSLIVYPFLISFIIYTSYKQKVEESGACKIYKRESSVYIECELKVGEGKSHTTRLRP